MTVVEFALIAPVLITFIMGIVELGLMVTAQNILDNASFSASRVGKTGYSASGSTQAQTITAAVNKAASTLLDPAKITVTSLAYADYGDIGQPEPFTDKNSNGKWDVGESFTDVNGNGKWDADQGASGYGASAQIVVYTATYSWKLFTPLLGKVIGVKGVVPLKSRIVVKNEPYS
ncbi:MAG TPA: TadE/TadG family type IV pilus assembly protein [Hansschlegelia sp.]